MRRIIPVILCLMGAGSLLLAADVPNFSLKTLDGATYRLSDDLGKKIIILDFWATWCEPCREEMPDLVKAAKKFSPKDLAVVLVSLDSQKTGPAQVPKFLSEKKVPYVSWLAKARDPQDFIDAVDPNWDGSLPYTLVYDRTGKVAARLSGLQTEASFAEAVRKVVGGK